MRLWCTKPPITWRFSVKRNAQLGGRQNTHANTQEIKFIYIGFLPDRSRTNTDAISKRLFGIFWIFLELGRERVMNVKELKQVESLLTRLSEGVERLHKDCGVIAKYEHSAMQYEALKILKETVDVVTEVIKALRAKLESEEMQK